jgi:3-hydroxyisobutyrate dehydrogenase-like beta-hydroxyacid dehydrogenase
MSMVPEGSHVRQVYLDETEGVLNSDLSHKLLIDFSTIDTATSLLVNERIKEKYPASSSSFYDAPVSGGPIGAENATLTVMLGCSDTDPNLPRLRELISLMGKSIVPCGGPSLGLTAKLCNNYLSGLTCIATAETYNIAIRSGLDPKLLHGIFQTSTAQNCMNDKFNPVPNVIADSPANRGYSGGFKVQLCAKTSTWLSRWLKELARGYSWAKPGCRHIRKRVRIHVVRTWTRGLSTGILVGMKNGRNGSDSSPHYLTLASSNFLAKQLTPTCR